MRLPLVLALVALLGACAPLKTRNFVVTGASLPTREAAMAAIDVDPAGMYFYDRQQQRVYLFTFDKAHVPKTHDGHGVRQISLSQLPPGMARLARCLSKRNCDQIREPDCTFMSPITVSEGQDAFGMLLLPLRKGLYPMYGLDTQTTNGASTVTVHYFAECDRIDADMERIIPLSGLALPH